jgi:hypothetical protein
LTEKYANDASTQDYLAHQQLARLQQEHLFDLARRDLDKCETPRERLGYLRFMGATLKQRDQIVASIQEHRRFCKRDQSPDGEQARLKRGRMVKMPIDEVFERDENMKRNWNHEWVRCLDVYIESKGLADKVPPELKETIVELPYLFKQAMKEREEAWQAQAAQIGPGPD